MVGSDSGFELPIRADFLRAAQVVVGRSRWMPDGRSIVLVGLNEQGLTGLFRQEFGPGRKPAPTPLTGFDPEMATESFGISPDGSRIAIAAWEQIFSLMIADRVPGWRVRRSR